MIGLWQSDPGGNLQVLHVRDGALVDRQTFYVENAVGREAGEVVEEFVLSYYDGGVMNRASRRTHDEDGSPLAAVLARGAAARWS